MYGIPLASQLENFWKEHFQNPNSDKWKEWVDKYREYLALKSVEISESHKNENQDGLKVIGMAKSGGCTKEVLLRYAGAKPDKPFTGASQFTFWIGHSVETAVLATLDVLGYKPDVQTRVYSKSGLRATASDAIIEYLGKPTVCSIKSTAYKMSGGKRDPKTKKYSFIRRGFASLPFEGIKQSEYHWYTQLQQEMYALDLEDGIIIVAAKDVVKAYENDEYMTMNGSLVFYAEHFKLDRFIAKKIDDFWNKKFSNFLETGEFGNAEYLTKNGTWVTLKEGEYIPDNIWGGENQKTTGTFNPCGGCIFALSCPSIRSVRDIG